MLDLLAYYLSIQSTLDLTMGANLFVNDMAPDATGIMLREDFGGTKINDELPGYLKTSFQLVARHPDHDEAYGLALAVSQALHFEDREMADGSLVKYVRPRIKPMGFPLSIGDYREFLVVFDLCYVEAP